MEDDDISSSLTQMIDKLMPLEYLQWKSFRFKVIKEIGPRLLNLSEADILLVFEEWEKKLGVKSSGKNNKDTMKRLLILSILSYLSRNLSLIIELFNTHFDIFDLTSKDVIKSATKVLYWVALENEHGTQIFDDVIEKSFDSKVFKDKKKQPVSLYVLLRAIKFEELGVFPRFLNNASHFFNLIKSSNDIEIVQLSARIISQQLKYITSTGLVKVDESEIEHSGASLIDLLNTYIQYYTSKNYSRSGELSGLITLMIGISKHLPNLFNDKENSILDATSVAIKSDSLEISRNAFKFWLKITDSEYSSFKGILIERLEDFMSVLYEKCSSILNDPTSFFNILTSTYKYYWNFIDKDKYFRFVSDVIEGDSYPIVVQTYYSMSQLLKLHPNVEISTDLLNIPSVMSDEYISLLASLPEVDESIIQQVTSYVKVNLVCDSDPYVIVLCLKIVQVFYDKLYAGEHELFEVLKTLTPLKEEKIQLEIVSTMAKTNSKESIEILLGKALFDEYESVRIRAISLLKPSAQLSTSPLLPLIISDPSIEIKKKAFQLLGPLSVENPFLLKPNIISALEDVLINISSLRDYSRSAELASILPLIAKETRNVITPYIEHLIICCLTVICPDVQPIKKLYSTFTLNQKEDPMNKPLKEKFAVEKPALYESKVRQTIFEVLNRHLINRRDGYLLQTIACFSDHVDQFLDHILYMYYDIFANRTDNQILEIAAITLASITGCIRNGLNLRTYYPPMIPVLTKILSSVRSQTVKIAVMKLIGTSVDSFDVPIEPEKVKSISRNGNDSFYPDFVLYHLSSLLFDNPYNELLKTVTSIFSSNPSESAKYEEKVIYMFISQINRAKEPDVKNSLFQSLEMITYMCPDETKRFLPELTECMINFVGCRGCMLLSSCLSYRYKNSFTPHVRNLFISAVGLLPKYTNFPETLKFCAFAICFQRQPFSMLLDALEQMSTRVSKFQEHTYKITKNLTFIVQSINVSIVQARIARLTRTLYRMCSSEKRSSVINLAFSIALTCQIPCSILETIIPGADLTEFSKVYQSRCFDLRQCSIIKVLAMEFKPTQFHIVEQEDPDTYFAGLECPTPISVNIWIENLYKEVVKRSPQPSIRACLMLMETSPIFKKILFPVAFLSCWEVVSEANREIFSNIVRKVSKHKHVNQEFVRIAEICDRARLPLNVELYTLSRISENKPLALYFLESDLSKSFNDDSLQGLLILNSKLGRNSSARGLLVRVENNPDDTYNIAQWNEMIGNWEKALELYKQAKSVDNFKTLESIVKCHAHLQHWSEIRDLQGSFWNLSDDRKKVVAHNFAWAFFKNGETEVVEKLLKYLRTNQEDCSISDIVFLAIFKLKNNELDSVNELIKQGFKLLVENSSVYNGKDHNTAQSNLSAAQLLVELSEAVRLKKLSREIRPEEVWTNRLSRFKRDRLTWMKLIDIRSLVVKPDASSGIYIKMLSVLRNEARFDIIDSYLSEVGDAQLPPELELASAKISWCRGNKEEAIKKLERIIDMNCDSMFLARVHRLYANYVGVSSVEALNESSQAYSKSTKHNEKDPRAWIGWAYTSSLLAQSDSKNSDRHSLNAVKGFLKAAALKGESAVEFLVQMFAMFFQIRDSKILEDDPIGNDIVSIQPIMLMHVLPQVTVQIDHKDKSIRDLVHKIITNFGEVHFQAVMFPLHLYSYQDDEKSQLANEILKSLSGKHQEEYNDAKLLVNGLISCALSPYERWIIDMDNAASQWNENNHITIKIFQNLLNEANYKNDLEKKFWRTYKDSIKEIKDAFENLQKANPNSPKYKELGSKLWELSKKFYKVVNEKANKLELILLQRVDDKLSTQRDFKICVPGSYSVFTKVPNIKFILNGVTVLRTQQHPRVLTIVNELGEKVKFLLKGQQDLRLDQRVMQFFTLINSIIKNSQKMRDYNAHVVEYPIIPLSPSSGLIRWVENADTLHHIINDMRNSDSDNILELDVISDLIEISYNNLLHVQRFEMIHEISKHVKAMEIRDYLWAHSQNADHWLAISNNFCMSTALMSMIGYIIGLGDRHPSNIMVLRDTGRVIHIDLSDIFEKNKFRPAFPEKTPFRLTRMIVNAIDGGTISGMFKEMCIDVMSLLRQNYSPLVSLLEIFIHEPIKDSNSSFPQLSTDMIISRIKSKLEGKDMLDMYDHKLEASEQVTHLIEQASDMAIYSTHYSGWCPYW